MGWLLGISIVLGAMGWFMFVMFAIAYAHSMGGHERESEDIRRACCTNGLSRKEVR